MIVLIDSGILGKLCNPNSSAEVEAAREKLYKLLARGVYIVSSQREHPLLADIQFVKR